MEEKKEKKQEDYDLAIKYIKNYLSEKCIILQSVCDKLSRKWTLNNSSTTFFVIPSVIYYNSTFRVKILIESVTADTNCIFYSRQDRISVHLADYKPELKEAIQDFVLSVMGDFLERGFESYRRETVRRLKDAMIDTKEINSENDLKNFISAYPLTPNESFIEFAESKEDSE